MKEGKHPQSVEECTIAFFKEKYGDELSIEEAREAADRVISYFTTLAEIAREEQAEQQIDNHSKLFPASESGGNDVREIS